MTIRCIWEHNGPDSLLHLAGYPGAYTRGASLEEALAKVPAELAAWHRWLGLDAPADCAAEIVQEHAADLQVRDADSDVLFDSEAGPLTPEDYLRLKALALRSAQDFLRLYRAVPDPDASCLPARATFYGQRPRTAREMYEHTKNVNSYYFGEIGVDAGNDGDIAASRARGFARADHCGPFCLRRCFSRRTRQPMPMPAAAHRMPGSMAAASGRRSCPKLAMLASEKVA